MQVKFQHQTSLRKLNTSPQPVIKFEIIVLKKSLDNIDSKWNCTYTWARANEEASIPVVAMTPPKIAVRLSPKESMSIPANGETKNVIPIDSEPTSAVK